MSGSALSPSIQPPSEGAAAASHDDRSAPSAQPLVSGTIIFLNGERYIDEAIRSVLAQTYQNWELLLVDDGSTDGATAIAQSYARRHPDKIRYLEHPHHENRGMSASRNLGIKHSRGELIAFLDADDIWEPHKLSEQVPLLQAHPEAAMLYGRTKIWFSWSGKPEHAGRDYLTDLDVEPDRVHEPPHLLLRMLRYDHDLPCTCSVLIRRAVIQRLGGYEEQFRHQFEDIVFYSKLFLEHRVFVSSKCWDKYRQHPESTCAVTTRLGLYDGHRPNPTRGSYLDWLAAYLAQKRLGGPGVRLALFAQRWPYLYPKVYAAGEKISATLKGTGLRVETAASQIAKACVPLAWRRRVWAKITGNVYLPPVGAIRFGDFRGTRPFGAFQTAARGHSIEQFYIERFLKERAHDLRGRVVVVDDGFTTLPDSQGGIDSTQVVPFAELDAASDSLSAPVDCVVALQVLNRTYDLRQTLKELSRMLKPGGILLATVPGISAHGPFENHEKPQYWNFTALSAAKFFAECFPEKNVTIESHGNVLTAIALLHGLTSEELHTTELENREHGRDVVITVRAVKATAQP